jgi:hypothetical protein
MRNKSYDEKKMQMILNHFSLVLVEKILSDESAQEQQHHEQRKNAQFHGRG